MGAYHRPRELADALDLLAAGDLAILAGGTDFYPARVNRAIDDDILDIAGIEALDGIEEGDDGWRLGATTTWSKLLEADLPPLFDGLKAAARELGGRQIQNTATLAGNLCNASPAADGVPPLLSLETVVELASSKGTRRLPLAEFIIANRRTALAPGEMVTALQVAKPDGISRGHFIKLGARAYLVISIAMVAGVLVADGDGRVAEARIAVGACSEVARRLPGLEAALAGRPIGAGLADVVTAEHLAGLSPIDDIRASADYRQDATATLVRRLLAGLAEAGA